MHFLRVAIAMNVMAVTLFIGTSRALEQSSAALGEKAEKAEVVFSILKGDDGIHYEGEGIEEAEVWGPASLRIAPDGTFLIVDTVTNRILRYTSDGVRVGVIRVGDAVGITDIATNGSNVFALDEAAPEPSIHRFSVDGLFQEKIPLSEDLRAQGLSGVAIDDSGKVVAEMHGGLATVHLDGGKVAGKVIRGESIRTQTPDPNDKSADRTTGLIIKNGNRFSVKVDNILGGLSVLSTGQDGDFYVLIEELADASTIQVDQTVRHYGADGSLLGIARVPLAARYTYVKHGVAVAPDGKVYALITRPDRADIVRLEFKQSLKSILPKQGVSFNLEKENVANLAASNAVNAVACSRTRDEMINTAWSYVNNQTYLNATNLNGTCSGRGKPRYLGATAGYYNSVPYDWGGFDTVSDYNNYMAQNYKAGDIDIAASETCSHGVDCSGFVSRCWGLTTKYSTRNIDSVSTTISQSQAQRGDIINKYDVHVAMIESIIPNGVKTLEATTDFKVDRVAYITNNDWSRFSGYSIRRYNNVCDSAGQGRPVVSSSLRLSSSGPYYTGQTLYGYFTITNRGAQSITLSRLLVGGRLNGDQSCNGGCPDFTQVSNIILAPGQSYPYSGSRYLDRSGAYSFFVAYQKTDGTWVTNVDTEGGALNTLSVTVQTSGPSLTGQYPSSVYASKTDQTIYLYGNLLTNTSTIYVQFPNGNGAYIYPPGQIFYRSNNQLSCKITLGNKGQYYFWAYTPEGGWSNAYGIWVY
jgi:cell wall-associated NlpC family hydrolase